MNRILRNLALFSLAIMMAGCSESFPGITKDDAPDITTDEELERVPIRLILQSQKFFSTAEQTRGTGAFDDSYDLYEQKKANSVFRVLGFRKTVDINGPLQGQTDFSATLATDEENKNCLLDNTWTAETTYMGARAKINAYNEAINGEDLTLIKNDIITGEADYYYSMANPTAGYEFYAYYLDDCEVSTRKESSRIVHDIVIDGSQDILYAKTEPITEGLLSVAYPYLELSAAQKNNIANIGYYSAYSGKYGVKPILNMQHQLARLKFLAYPGDKESNNVTIQSVFVKSVNKGEFVVASRNKEDLGLHFKEGETADLYLCNRWRKSQEKSEPLAPVKVYFDEEEADLPWEKRTSTVIGESLMLPEAEMYELHVQYTQKIDGESGVHELEGVYFLKAPTIHKMFKKGYSYTAKLQVYGMKAIQVSVEADPWVEVEDGNLTIGEEK